MRIGGVWTLPDFKALPGHKILAGEYGTPMTTATAIMDKPWRNAMNLRDSGRSPPQRIRSAPKLP